MDGARGRGERLLTAETTSQLHLVVGNPTLAEPKARELAQRLAGEDEYTVARHRESLAGVLDDLETYSLFGEAKVVVAIDTALLADKRAAAALVDAAVDDPVDDAASELNRRQRWCATRLFTALKLFGIDAFEGPPSEVVAGLPEAALKGASGRLGEARVNERRQQLALLLEAAREQDVSASGEAVGERLIDALESGFPERHHLILVESSVAPDQPLVERLRERGALIEVGDISAERGGGWAGVDRLARAMEEETGVEAEPGAIRELAERTLKRKPRDRSGVVDDSSAERFAAEYRKLASFADGRIERADVERIVTDRGDQDVFQILDAVGEGDAGAALHRFARYQDAASDPIAARLGFFSQLATFCRHLVWIDARLAETGLDRGVSHYPQFKQRLAPRLSAESGVGELSGIHPYRLHKAYLAASRLRPGVAASLPARVFTAEQRVKGESRSPDLAVEALLAEVCALLA